MTEVIEADNTPKVGAAGETKTHHAYSAMKILGLNKQCDLGALVFEDCNNFSALNEE
jgi:hypothetical protein